MGKRVAAPAIIFDDADLDIAVRILSASKYRNAGQVCVAPPRFLVQNKLHDSFLDKFINATRNVRMGNCLEPETTVGPLAHDRRVAVMECLVADALEKGAEIRTGGSRVGNKGYFWVPTIVTHAANNSRVMNEEPSGLVAVIVRFNDFRRRCQRREPAFLLACG